MKLFFIFLLFINYFLYSEEGDIIWKSTITPSNPSLANGGSDITILGEQVFIGGIIDTNLTSFPLQLNGVIASYNILDGKEAFQPVRLQNTSILGISSIAGITNRVFISGVTLAGQLISTPRLYFATVNPTNGNITRPYTYTTESYASKNFPLTENQIYVAANIVQNLDVGYLLFNNLAQLQQQNIYQTTTEEFSYDIKVSTNQNIYITGKQKVDTASGYDIFILKWTPQIAQPQILKVDYKNSDDVGCAIHLSKSNEIFVAGYVTISTEPFQAGLWVMKYDENLNPIWQQPFIKQLTMDATSFNKYFVNQVVPLCDIIEDEGTQNIYIIYNEVENDNPTAYLLKLDKNKNIILERQYPKYIFTSMCLDTQKNIYTTGSSFENGVEIATWKIEGAIPKGYISGVVISKEEGIPLVGSRIEAYKNNEFIAETIADTDGKYTLKIPTGAYIIKASSYGYISQFSEEVYVEEDSTTTVNFLLEKVNFGFLTGTVLSEQGEPIPNANVVAIQNQVIVSSTTTQQDGSYLMTLDVGSYEIEVSAFGYQTQIATSVVINPAQTTTKNFILKKLSIGYLKGTILDDEGVPIAGSIIEVLYNDLVVSSVTANISGEYFVAIPTGNYTVKASSEGFLSASSSTTIVENSTTTLNFILKKIPKGILKGYVLSSEGDSINLAKLDIYIEQQLIKTIYSNSDGSYEVILSTGAYKIEVSASGYQSKTEENIIVYEGSTTFKNFILQKIPKGYITGKITAKNTQNPIPGTLIEVIQNSQVIASTTAANNGNYLLEVAPGTYTIKVSSEGYMTVYSTGITVNDQQTITLNFSLEKIKLGVLKGIVLDYDTSQPIAGVLIKLTAYNLLISSITTDETGNYSFICQIGSYTVEASIENYEKQQKIATIVENSTTTLNFVLSRVYFIEGKVTTYNNQPLSGVVITLVCLNDSTTSQTLTDTQGCYKFQQLKKSDYKVYPQKDGWTFQPQQYIYYQLNSNKTSQNFIAYPQQTPPSQEKILLPIGEISKPKKDEIKIVTSNQSGKIVVNDKIYIVFNSVQSKEYKLRIFNIVGDELYNDKKVASSEYEFFEYTFKDLPSGTYIVVVETDNSKIVKKVSLVK